MTSSEKLEAKRRKVAEVVDILGIILLLLVLAGLCFNVYAFNVYRGDVRGNREVLCEAPALKNERYCRHIENDAADTTDKVQ